METPERIPKLTRLEFDGTDVNISPDGNLYIVRLMHQTYQVELLNAAIGRLELLIDGRRIVAYVTADAQSRWVTIHGRTQRLNKSSATRQGGAGRNASPELSAPMPGQVKAVNVRVGDVVTQGQVLVVLEAMKMEIRLQAPQAGEVLSVETSAGQTVEREQVLVRMRYS